MLSLLKPQSFVSLKVFSITGSWENTKWALTLDSSGSRQREVLKSEILFIFPQTTTFSKYNKKFKTVNKFISHIAKNNMVWIKVAPQMAALVLRSLALSFVLFIFRTFGHSDHITFFSRDQLLNIRQSSQNSFYPFFINLESFLEILVKAQQLSVALEGDADGGPALVHWWNHVGIPHGTPLHSSCESLLSSKQSGGITAFKPG